MIDNKLKIGDLEINSKVVIAPMAGISNNAFKSIIRTMTEGLITTEMVNDKAILHGNQRTLKMMEIEDGHHPLSLQLFGNEVDSMVKAAIYLDKQTNCDIIDINMGCPAPKIVKNNAGSKILLDPQKVYEIALNVKKAVSKPVTVKMRIGWDENNINLLENVKILEKAGVDAIFIHGRTTKQMYSGKANWDIIKEAKKLVKIPIIGNGDITNAKQAYEYLNKYELDGIMIGRAALGDPWLIKRVDHYFQTQTELEEPSILEKINMCEEHFNKLLNLKGEKIAVNEMRGHTSWYLKGIKGANKYKREVQNINNKEEFYSFINTLKTNLTKGE